MILAIDTSSKTATAALVENTAVLAEYSVLSDKTHSKALLPMVESLFSHSGRSLADLSYIACTVGPGSFTGIRIGAAVAKGLAFASNKKIIPVASLDMLAYNVLTGNYVICPMLDARGGHVYTAFYEYCGQRLERLSEYMTLPANEAVSYGKERNWRLIFTGGGAEAYAEALNRVEDADIVPAQLNAHRAGTLGLYAEAHLNQLNILSGAEFRLMYMSRSQAEAQNG